MRKPKKILQWRFAFLLILLILVNTRFIGIENFTLSPSEAAEYSRAALPLSEILYHFSFSTSHSSPFFSILLHFWIAIFGHSESALRALPALFSSLALFPFFGIARMLFNKRIAFGAAALYAFSPLGTALGQEQAPTSLFMLFTLISTWSLLTSMRRPQTLFKLIYFASFMGALFCNPGAWYLLAFHSIFFIGAYFNHDSDHLGFRAWLLIMSAAAAAVTITFPGTLPPVHSSFEQNPAVPFIGMLTLLLHFCGSLPLVIPASAALFILLFRSKMYRNLFPLFAPRLIFIVLWLAVLSIPPYLFSFEPGSLGRADGAAAGLFPFLLLISAAIDTAAKNTHRHALFLSLFALSALAAAIAGRHHSVPWKELLSDSQKPGIIAVGENLESTLSYYGDVKSRPQTLILSDSLLLQAQKQVEIRQFCRDHDRITLISSSTGSALLQNFLAEQFQTESDTYFERPRWRFSTEKSIRVIQFSR